MRGSLGVSHLVHRSYEPVAALGYRLDVLPPAVPLPQDFPQEENVLVEVSFLDKGIGPDPLHQVVFVHQASGVLDQYKQRFRSLGGQGNRGTVAHQDALLGVQPKWTKGVEVLGLQRHTGCHNFARNLPELWQEFKTAIRLRCGTSGVDAVWKAVQRKVYCSPVLCRNTECRHSVRTRLSIALRRCTVTAFLPTLSLIHISEPTRPY